MPFYQIIRRLQLWCHQVGGCGGNVSPEAVQNIAWPRCPYVFSYGVLLPPSHGYLLYYAYLYISPSSLSRYSRRGHHLHHRGRPTLFITSLSLTRLPPRVLVYSFPSHLKKKKGQSFLFKLTQIRLAVL